MISNWSNLVARRDLLRELTLAELRAQSQETRLGWLFWLVDPLIMMLIYWAVVVGLFGRGGNYSPYPVFILCAMLPWKHFTSSLTSSAKILRGRDSLIKAIAFPTMALPLTIVFAGFSNFLFGMVVLLGAAALFQLPLEFFSLLQILPLMLIQLMLVTGICLSVACFGALVRDLSGFLGHATRMGFYLSPTLYGVDMVAERFTKTDWAGPWAEWIPTLYMLNPFAILFTGYREALFYGRFLEPHWWALLIFESAVLLVGGYLIYQYFDRRVIKFL